MEIIYQVENNIQVDEFRDVLLRSSLGQRRPLDSDEKLSAMLRHSNLVVSARVDGLLVGISRSLTDFVFCTYLSDLAVDQKWQRQGIGKTLIRRTKIEAPQAKLILLAAPAAIDYYPRIGMHRHPHCYILDDLEELT